MKVKQLKNGRIYLSEVWTKINFTDFYEVSDLGRVRSTTHLTTQTNTLGTYTRVYLGKIIKPRKAKNGYLYVSIKIKGEFKSVKVHRLVAEHFIPNVENKPEVNHINGIKVDNAVSNLEWNTSSENKRHAFELGLNSNPKSEKAKNYRGDVLVFKDGVLIDTLKGHEDIISKGYTSCGVSSVLTGKAKTHRGCTFKIEREYDEH